MTPDDTNQTRTASIRQLMRDYVLPRTASGKLAWGSGIVIMLLSGFHFIIEYAPKIFPALLHNHTALTDFIYSLDVPYETSALVFVAGAIMMGAAYTLPGANPSKR